MAAEYALLESHDFEPDREGQSELTATFKRGDQARSDGQTKRDPGQTSGPRILSDSAMRIAYLR